LSPALPRGGTHHGAARAVPVRCGLDPGAVSERSEHTYCTVHAGPRPRRHNGLSSLRRGAAAGTTPAHCDTATRLTNCQLAPRADAAQIRYAAHTDDRGQPMHTDHTEQRTAHTTHKHVQGSPHDGRLSQREARMACAARTRATACARRRVVRPSLSSACSALPTPASYRTRCCMPRPGISRMRHPSTGLHLADSRWAAPSPVATAASSDERAELPHAARRTCTCAMRSAAAHLAP